MKSELTLEQSRTLLKLGLKPQGKLVYIFAGRRLPIFTFTDLLEILPECIESEIQGRSNLDRPFVPYSMRIASKRRVEYRNDYYGICVKFQAEELIDSLYKMVIWCVENGYIKIEENE